MSSKHEQHAMDIAVLIAAESVKACFLCIVAVAAFCYYAYKAVFAPAPPAKPAIAAKPALQAKPYVQPLYAMATKLEQHTLRELQSITAINKKIAKHKLIAMYAAG